MIKVYYELIKMNLKDIEDVPEGIKDEVQSLLDA